MFPIRCSATAEVRAWRCTRGQGKRPEPHVGGRHRDSQGHDRRVTGKFAADRLAECQVRWPTVPIEFCESRSLAEEFTYRYLIAVLQHCCPHVGSAEAAAIERIGVLPIAE